MPLPFAMIFALAAARPDTQPHAPQNGPTYIFFKRKSAQVDARAYEVLRHFIAPDRPGAPLCTIHVEATSESGRFEHHGDMVAQRRAISTRSALLKLGVPADRIRFDWGTSHPTPSTDQNGPDAMDRSARLTWIDPCG